MTQVLTPHPIRCGLRCTLSGAHQESTGGRNSLRSSRSPLLEYMELTLHSPDCIPHTPTIQVSSGGKVRVPEFPIPPD